MGRCEVRYNGNGPQGNIFYILGKTREAMLAEDRAKEYEELRRKVVEARNYKAAIATIEEYVDLIDTQNE